MASERYTRIWDAEKKTAVRIHRSDNRPENLRVLPSQGHHMALEQLQRKVERGTLPLFGFDELLK